MQSKLHRKKILKARESYIHSYEQQAQEKGQNFLGKRKPSGNQPGENVYKNQLQEALGPINSITNDKVVVAREVIPEASRPKKHVVAEQFSRPVKSPIISEQLNSVDRFWDKESLLAHVQKSQQNQYDREHQNQDALEKKLNFNGSAVAGVQKNVANQKVADLSLNEPPSQKNRERNQILEKIKNVQICRDQPDFENRGKFLSEEDLQLKVIKCDDSGETERFTVRKTGSTIGRNSNNQIRLLDETVSRFHAEITYNHNQKKYFVKDLGSTSGSFVLSQKVRLIKGLVIEIGSHEFQITHINIAGMPTKNSNKNPKGNSSVSQFMPLSKENYLSPNLVEQRYSYIEVIISDSEKPIQEALIFEEDSIGRRCAATCSLPQDEHMSGLHCILKQEGDELFFVDNKSMNGLWVRMSKPGKASELLEINSNATIRVGSVAKFKFELEPCNYT